MSSILNSDSLCVWQVPYVIIVKAFLHFKYPIYIIVSQKRDPIVQMWKNKNEYNVRRRLKGTCSIILFIVQITFEILFKT